MQNKANFGKAQMNVSSSITMNYEQKTMNYTNKNKPNTKPIKANTKPIKAKTNPIQTQFKPNFKRGLALPSECRYSNTRHAQRRS